jgi:hypothetical protein
LLGDAQASKKSRRNTAIGLGAMTAYGLLNGNKTLSIVGGLGTAYAYSGTTTSKSELHQTIGQVFGDIPVCDSRGNRYSHHSRFIPSWTYYNTRFAPSAEALEG